MNHLDPKALEAARNAIVDVWDDARGIDPNLHTMAEKAIAAYLDALSSLPAQAVKVGASVSVWTDGVLDPTQLAEVRIRLAPSQPAAVGEGWKLVPVEPTPEMLMAYHGALKGLIDSPEFAGARLRADGRVGGVHIGGNAKATARYCAMLDAAPALRSTP